MKATELKNELLIREERLSEYATLSKDAVRIRYEREDIRPAYFHDIDRIIHCLSYTRYLDKTQVYVRNSNNHISKRITHVQLVSKIARTIGRALNLNEDLIEAIALGHDLGHTPLGHEGEAILNDISIRELGEYFAHNIHSVRLIKDVEFGGVGLNLTVQVLDGIMCHNGEILSSTYEPEVKTKEIFLEQYNNAYKDLKNSNKNRPMSLEGCVVRISDIIGYIGRDIEDAIMIGNIKRSDIPRNIVSVLGDNNTDIVNTLILDIIENSIGHNYIKMSDDVFNALFKLKKFNYEHIYVHSLTREEKEYYRDGMNKLFKKYLNDLNSNNKDSIIYTIFLDKQVDGYKSYTSNKRIVIDFIAGMTDDLFIREINNL